MEKKSDREKEKTVGIDAESYPPSFPPVVDTGNSGAEGEAFTADEIAPSDAELRAKKEAAQKSPLKPEKGNIASARRNPAVESTLPKITPEGPEVDENRNPGEKMRRQATDNP
ncbi:MAG TPA: hypothetical protein VHV83_18205 [Armatimonadota bacterium]|nr:hypothetical protein [Armatimonadota bacterium]